MSSRVDADVPAWQLHTVGVQRWQLARLKPAQGRPNVLLLHGFPDAPAHWLPVAERLAKAGFGCTVPYLPGYGGSDSLPMGHDVQSLAEATLALMDSLSHDPWYLVGHDWGAVIAYGVSALAPARVQAAVTAAVPPLATFQRNLIRHPGQLRRSWYMGYFQLPTKPEQALADSHAALLIRLWRDWSPGLTDVRPYVEEVRRALDSPQKVAAALGYYRALFGRTPGGWSRWRSNYALVQQPLMVPTCILAGDADGCIGLPLFDGSADAFARRDLCQFSVVHGAGHFMQLEQPTKVSQLIADWLRLQPL